MTKCQVCTAEMKHGAMCRACWSDLGRALGHVPDVAAELEITTTRQAVIGAHSEIPHRKGDDRPLPFNWSSDHDDADLLGTLSGWVRILEPNPTKQPAGDVTSMAGWLRDHGNLIRGHEQAADIHDQITYAISQAWRAVDRPANRTSFDVPYRCPECLSVVKAIIPTDDDEPATWRCEGCGTVTLARDWIKRAEAMLKDPVPARSWPPQRSTVVVTIYHSDGFCWGADANLDVDGLCSRCERPGWVSEAS